MQLALQHIVILYSHPLLGEGIAQLLSAHSGLEVELVAVDDGGATRTALEANPDVVILERNSHVQALELLRMAPSALFIDVGLDAGPSWAYHRDLLSGQPEGIVDVIRGRSRDSEPIAH